MKQVTLDTHSCMRTGRMCNLILEVKLYQMNYMFMFFIFIKWDLEAELENRRQNCKIEGKKAKNKVNDLQNTKTKC